MTTRKAHLDTLAVFLLLGCCVFWGLQQVLIKATIAEIAPMFQASLRLVGATALLWLWCVWRRIPLFSRDGSLAAGLLGAMATVAVGIVLVNRKPEQPAEAQRARL